MSRKFKASDEPFLPPGEKNKLKVPVKPPKPQKVIEPRRTKTPDEIDYRFRIYPPSGQHNKFRVIKVFKVTQKTETVYSSDIDAINEQFLSKVISADDARAKLSAIVKKLYQRDGVKLSELEIHPDNMKVLNNYWKVVYENRIDVSARYEHERAIRFLDNTLLRKNSQSELQKTLDKNAEGNRHRRAVFKINSLLRFLDRDFTLTADTRSLRTIKFITIEDFSKLLQHLPDTENVKAEDIRTLHEVVFYTGVQIGEAFALDSRTYKPDSDTIRVGSQIDRSGKKRAGRLEPRDTVVLPQGRDALMRWFQTQKKIPIDLRVRISRITKKAAFEAFPESYKHITFADLRHSYAIHLIKSGVPIGLVAQCLGISEASAKELYGKYDTSKSGIDYIVKTLKSNRAG